MHSRLENLTEALMEACWLAAAAMIPLFFNISSAQVFEPDKMFVLKFLALLSGAGWLLTQFAAAARKNMERLNLLSKNPLVKPVLALALIYVLSSIFSVVPSLSWWGSYKRCQGTFSLFCYVILFLVVATELRRPEQIKRLQFTFILTSIPAAAYAIMQQMGLDSLPWVRILGERVPGTMGNPIFLGGYLVMVIPLTVCRMIEAIGSRRRDRDGKSGLVLIGSCTVALALQLAALLFTRSRGPVAGLVAAGYICTLVFLVLNRTPRKSTRIVPFMAALLGVAVPLLVLAAVRSLFKLPIGIALAGVALAVGVSAIVYLLFWRTPGGRSWFWLTWLAQPFALALLLAVVPPNTLSSFVPSALGRFSELSDSSIVARISLWESCIESLRKGSPPVLPEGTRDRYFFLRRAIGYGPECSWLPVNIHMVPSMLKREVETEDRMHNEPFDDLLTTGIAGSLAFLVIVGAGFFYSLRLLGFAGGSGGKSFLLLTFLGTLVGTVIPFVAGVPHYLGIGIEIGLLSGIVAFIAWSGFRQSHGASEGKARQLLVLGILGGLSAHLIEIGVGIAVAPTRLYFFLFLALLGVLSVRGSILQEMPVKTRRSRTEQGLQDSLLPYAALSGFVILTLSWCFTFNSSNEQSPWAVFWKTWFSGRWTGLPVSGALLLLVLTIGGSFGLLASEKSNPLISRSAFRKQLFLSGLLLAGVWIVVGVFSGMFWTVQNGSFPVEVSSVAESRITFFLIAFLVLLLGTAFILAAREASRQAMLPIRIAGWMPAIGLLICAIIGTHQLVLRPAWADIASRVAEFYGSTGSPASAVLLYERASNFAPHEVAYRLSLGSAQIAAGVSDSEQLARAAATLRQAWDLNPLDPVACRRLATFHMQSAERSSDPAVRADEIKVALSYLKRAYLIAPKYPDAYSEMGRCYFLMGDYETASSLYRKALNLSPGHSRTYMFLGEMYYRRGNLEEALKHFGDAAKFDTSNIEARKNVGFLLALLGRPEEAIRADLDTLRIVPQDSLLLTRLAVLYFGQNNYGKGLEYARLAYNAMPASGKGSLEEFIEKLKNQGK